MNSKKLWQAFALIFGYLFLSVVSCQAGVIFFNILHAKWGVALGFGIAFWVISLVFFLARKKGIGFVISALPFNAAACGLLISAFLIGKKIAISFPVLLLLGVSIACFYLLFMLFLSFPLKTKGWYVSVALFTYLLIAVLLGAWLYPILANALNVTLPKDFEWILAFFYLLLGFLSFGSVTEAENLKELLLALIAPALCVTCLLGIAVVIIVAFGDSDCDCDCCDASDCCVLDKEYNGTTYAQRKNRKTSLSEMSNPLDLFKP